MHEDTHVRGDGRGAPSLPTRVTRTAGRIRCAIYTRKSSEEGLEQDFNSLHAQREACEAYILSQRHEGWDGLVTLYDDGGHSGGTLLRPALARLLADIDAGHVDCVVVYKVDRLTRSLSDFARIVDRFDAKGVSFVSVTQAFNTTNSMGRLTLNVLLSFAQFEREVTGERIRDKIAASKHKGLWMGGWVPIGYDAANRTLTVNEVEAATVRAIFQLYLELGNVRLVQDGLHNRGLVTKSYTAANGKVSGGMPFSRGHLYKILGNPLYRGQIVHKGTTHRGQHPAIIDASTWNAAQAQLKENGHARRTGRNVRVPSLLAGLLVGSEGERLVPVHANKDGRRYRYYVSEPSGRGCETDRRRAGSNRGPALRLAAAEVEPLLLSEVAAFLRNEVRVADWAGVGTGAGVEASAGAGEGAQVGKVERLLARAATLASDLERGSPAQKRGAVLTVVRQARIERHAIWITLVPARELLNDSAPNPIGGASVSQLESRREEDHDGELTLHVPVTLMRRGVETKLVLSNSATARSPEPDRSLIKALAQAHVWWGDLSTGRVSSIGALAQREGVTDRYVSHVLDLAFLAPSIVDAILAGTQPQTLTAKALTLGTDLPLQWQQQREMLGHGP